MHAKVLKLGMKKRKHSTWSQYSIGSSLGIDLELIWDGLDWSGPDIRPGLDNRHFIIEGHRGIKR